MKKPATAPSGLSSQADDFLAHLDELAELLRPRRRPQDRDLPECSASELRALAALGRLGAIAMSDLAAMLGLPISTATRIVDRLVAKDLAARRRSPQDRRIVQVSFSPKGQRIHEFVVATRRAAASALLESLPSARRASLLRQLSRIARTLP